MSGQGGTGAVTDAGAASGVRPIVAGTAAALLPAFLEWIADAPTDPFESQVVVVPNVGMAEYLEAAIRAANGVCANVEFLVPGRLRERSGVAAVWPWSVEETTWSVLAALDDPALAARCGLTARLEERPLAVARHIAELFDRYHSYRPGLIEAWRDGAFIDDLDGSTLDERFRWQYELLRAVDDANPPPAAQPRTLPHRVALFGAGEPVGAQARLIRTLAADTDITAFLLVPGPLPDALERWAAPAVAALDAFTGGTGHRPVGPAALPEVELHLCYGPAREFDAARDAILGRFAADPALTAREVTVIAPAIHRTAPLAAPILGAPLADGTTGEPLHLPVRIADRVPTLTPGVALAIDGVLGLAAGRCRATEVLAVLRLAPVASAFGLSADAAERVSTWVLDGLDVRWGLDAEHRRRWGYEPRLTVGAWAPAIDRLLTGLLIQNPDGTAVALDEQGTLIVPFDDISGSEFELVGSVAAFVAAVRDLSTRAGAGPTPAEWADILESILATFIVDDPSTRRELNAARELIGTMRSRAGAIGRAVTISEARALFGVAFDERTGSARNRHDAITIGGPRARRGVPHRLTVLVGLDDDATRSGTVSGDDVLAATDAGHPWEADRSEEARLALLDALLASDHAIITTTAHDVVTNRPLGLPVVVEELADASAELRAALDGEPEAGARVLEHRRRLADEPTYDPAGPAWARALAANTDRGHLAPVDRPDA
ncbi:MAG: exodeoxyribonuclease V subunit gamma, partial [Actinomycetota bacterium]